MLILAAAPLCAASLPNSSAPRDLAGGFDRAAWKTDLQRIERGLAQGYANFDWQIDKRGFNPVRADQQLNAMLDQATSDVEAVVILSKLMDALHDPHLQLLPGPPPAGATLIPRQSNADVPIEAADTCRDSHYSDGKAGTALAYAKSREWREIASGPFQAGLIGDIGVVRIPSFDEQRYLETCNSVAKPGMDDRELQLATRAELNRRLAATVENLRRLGMTKLVVDVSGNGGGSEWSSEAAAMFASGMLKRNAPRLAGPKCDRSGLWKGESACSVYGAEPETEEMKGTGLWTGPLAILTDRKSASAAEEFVTWLKDNKRAVIAGDRTYGAGCGYVDGGNAIALRAARLHLMVPNCSRYTREGVNEIEGISPDRPVQWMILKPEEAPAVLRSLFPG